MPPYCRLVLTVVHVHSEARVLKAWYGCTIQENASVANVYYEWTRKNEVKLSTD